MRLCYIFYVGLRILRESGHSVKVPYKAVLITAALLVLFLLLAGNAPEIAGISRPCNLLMNDFINLACSRLTAAIIAMIRLSLSLSLFPLTSFLWSRDSVPKIATLRDKLLFLCFFPLPEIRRVSTERVLTQFNILLYMRLFHYFSQRACIIARNIRRSL